MRPELRTQAPRVDTSSQKAQRTQGCVQTRGWRWDSATLWVSPLYPVAAVSSLQPAPHSLKSPWRATVYAKRYRIAPVPVTLPTGAFSPSLHTGLGMAYHPAQQHWWKFPSSTYEIYPPTHAHTKVSAGHFNLIIHPHLCFILPIYKPQQHPTPKSLRVGSGPTLKRRGNLNPDFTFY